MGVTHSVRGRFGPSPTTLAVVFARKNSLDSYVVRANANTARLELLQTVPLHANVLSMAVLRRAHSDLLIVAFDRLRIAIMSWDHRVREWTTEQVLDLGEKLGSPLCSPEALGKSMDEKSFGKPLIRGRGGEEGCSIVKADPAARCFLVHSDALNSLWVVPVRAEDECRAGEKIVHSGDVFLIDLKADYELANVKDYVFLHGTFEPNVLILAETKRTWSGRTAIQKNTCHLMNLLLDIRSRKHSKSWTMDQLPYDCEKVEAIPESAGGGALVISASVIMQVKHGACNAGLALNCFGDNYAMELKGKYGAISKSDTLVECDAAHCRFLDYEEKGTSLGAPSTQSIALLSLKGGELYFLSVAVGARNSLIMKRAGSTVIASEIIPINERFFILASRLSDSLLIEYQRAIDTEEANGRDDAKDVNDTENPNEKTTKKKQNKPKKRKRSAEEEADYESMYGVKPPPDSSDDDSDGADEDKALKLEEKEEGTRGVYDDEDELGWVFSSDTANEAAEKSDSAPRKWALKVKDTLTCFGPGADLTVGISPDDITKTKLDMVIAGGYAKNGCLAVIHQSIRPTNRTEFNLENCRGAWALFDPMMTRKESLERQRRNAAVLQRNAERRERNKRNESARKQFVEAEITRIKKDAKAAEKDKDQNSGSGKNKPPEEAQSGDIADSAEHSNTAQNETSEPSLPHESANGEPAATSDPEIKGPVNGDSSPPAKRVKLDETVDNQSVEETEASPFVIDPELLGQLQMQAEVSFPFEIDEMLEEEPVEGSAQHAYLLLSTATGTIILQTGVEIDEIKDTMDFITGEPTISAGNVLEDHAIVQVTPSRIRVLKNGRNQYEYKSQSVSGDIKYAQVSDPFVLIHTTSETLTVLKVVADHATESEEDVLDLKRVVDNPGDEFDEYGMAVSRVEKVSTEESASDRLNTYKNFSLVTEYSVPGGSPDETVVSAHLYKGPLAGTVSKGMNIDSGEQKQDNATSDEVQKEDVETGPDKNASSSTEKEQVNTSSENKNQDAQIDDDDGLLYGDDDINEEDMMLYGSGPGDVEAMKRMNKSATATLEEQGAKTDEQIGSSVKHEDGAIVGKSSSTPYSERGILPIHEVSERSDDGQHLLAVCTRSGFLRVISPTLEWNPVLENPVFFSGPPLVEHLRLSEEDKKDFPNAADDMIIDSVVMMELSASALIPGLSTAILVAISRTGTPLVYRAFAPDVFTSKNASSPLVLQRVAWRDRTANIFARSMSGHSSRSNNEPGHLDISNSSVVPGSALIPFKNIAGRGGLFVGGRSPFLLFAERGYPRLHPLSHPGPKPLHVEDDDSFQPVSYEAISKEDYESGHEVLGFTEFHNSKCPRGFVSVWGDGMVRIGELSPPSEANYDAPTPMRKISLRCTPHKVAYHMGSATYGVLASMPTLTTREERLARILQSLEKHDKRHYMHTAAQAEAEAGDEIAKRVPPLFEELHELRVYRPDTWELIKSYKLGKGEVGLALANIKVDVFRQMKAGNGVDIPSSKKGEDGNESAFAASLRQRPKDMLVVGTGYLNGEDASSRGRLLLFEISRQEFNTENGFYTAFQLQLIAGKEIPGPVSAVASMEGYVIAGVGPQIGVYKLVGDEIIHLSFAFGQLYCTSIASIKQYVVAADMCKSVTFMYFRERNNSVNFLGKDYELVTSYATEFLIENENLSIVVSDENANIQMLNYAHASVPESRGGKRLLVHGGTFFGSRINKFVRVRRPDGEADLRNNTISGRAGTHSLLFTTADGGIGAVAAVSESEFRKLHELRNNVVKHMEVERYGGINGMKQCEFRPLSPGTEVLDQRILDSRVMYEVFDTNLIEQRLIARKGNMDIGTMVRLLMPLDEVVYRF